MKKQFFSFLFLLTLVFSVSAQKAQKADATEQNLRAHVTYLASDQLEGRRTGETGAISAAGYVANMFANFKLATGVDGKNEKGKQTKNYLQSFPYITGIETGAGNSFQARLNEKIVEISNEIKPVGFSPNGAANNTPVVFAGFGIVSTEPKFDDYANVEARGKIVVAFEGLPDNDNPHTLFWRFNSQAKALIAKERGAVGLILISREANFADERLTKLTYDQTVGEAAIPTFVISREAAAKMFGAADIKELDALEKIAAMRKDVSAQVAISFPNVAPTASFTVNLVKKTVEAYNVIGILPGRDAVLKNEAIIIGAHYDHLGRGGQGSLAVNSTEIHHGADDNASGVAAMLELARRFAKSKDNKRTLIFMAFSGEEEGLLGSAFYVGNPVFPLNKTVTMINMDMVGRLKEDKLTVGGIGTASEWKKLIESENPRAIQKANFNGNVGMNLTPTFKVQLNEDGFGPSDHSSFYGKQIPVLFFFTGTHNDYHKPSDTSDKINYDGLLKVTNFVGEIVKAVDRNPNKPTYTVAKSSMTGGGRSGFNISLGTVPNYADGDNSGLILDGVRDDSPAAKAGVKAGDKITKLAGHDIKNINDYTFVLGEIKAGEEYEITVVRGTETLNLKIVPAARK